MEGLNCIDFLEQELWTLSACNQLQLQHHRAIWRSGLLPHGHTVHDTEAGTYY